MLKDAAELALNSPDANKKSELNLSSELIDLKVMVAQNKVATINASPDGIQLRTAKKARFSLTEQAAQITFDRGSWLAVKDKGAKLGTKDAFLEVKDKNLTLQGGGGTIKMANNSVTIGDLKISGLSGATSLDELKKSQQDFDVLMKKFEKFETDIDKQIKNKDKEIKELKDQLSKKIDRRNFEIDDY
jgi:hypothetical protein